MTANQPDWASIAEKFDLWLPHIAPVGEALLAALEARKGDRIIDLGSGTGEPALTLARRMGDQVDITGIDSAGPMAAVARDKVDQERLTGIRDEVALFARDFHGDSGLRIPHEYLVATGFK